MSGGNKVLSAKVWSAAVVIAAMVAYAAFFSWFTVRRADNFNAGWYDLGIMSQTVWNFGHGHGFTFTNPEPGINGVHGLNTVRTAIHTDYLLMLLAPLSWWGTTWINLLVFQAVIIAAGAWFVFRLAESWLHSKWLGVFLALVYLLYPPLQFANLFEFHAVSLGVTFFLAAAWAITRNRWGEYWVWAGLALITKEQVGISLALFAGFLWWWRGSRRRAVVAASVALLWAIVQIFVVIPFSRPDQNASFVYGKFYGESETSTLSGLSLKTVWAKLNTATHRHDVVQLLTPLGVISPVISPISYLVIPEMLIYWVSDSPNQQTLYMHYHALTVPFLFVGLILGWRFWLKLGRRRGRYAGMAVSVVIIGAVALGTAWCVWHYSLWPWSPATRWPLIAWKEKQAADVKEALALVPDRAVVAATQNLGPQVSSRPTVKLLPTGASDAEYIVILQRSFNADTQTNDKRWAEKQMLEELIAWLKSDPNVRKLYENGRVWLFQRVGQPTSAEPEWPAGLLGQ